MQNTFGTRNNPYKEGSKKLAEYERHLRQNRNGKLILDGTAQTESGVTAWTVVINDKPTSIRVYIKE